MSNWILLQHVSYEGPGLISSEAQNRGAHLQTFRMDKGMFPSMETIDGLIVMGGPMGVYEEEKYPFLNQECRLIETLVRRDVPVLGVCLGAQLLARALGANVFRGQEPEVGFAPVELTTEGKRDPIFQGVSSSIPAFHWHGDTFDLPLGAALLASNANYSNQAFRFGRCVYGLQFHLEPDLPVWAEWRQRLPANLFDNFDQKRITLLEVGRKVIANFFDLAL